MTNFLPSSVSTTGITPAQSLELTRKKEPRFPPSPVSLSLSVTEKILQSATGLRAVSLHARGLFMVFKLLSPRRRRKGPGPKGPGAAGIPLPLPEAFAVETPAPKT